MAEKSLMQREQFAVVVLLGGYIPRDEEILATVRQAEYCVCADSGAEIARVSGRVPDLLVGDMDSVSADTYAWCQRAGTAEKRYLPEKDYTDGELALYFACEYAAEHDIHSVAVVGALGDRPDHTMANVFRGKRLVDRGVAVSYLNDDCFIYVLSGAGRRQVALADGRTVSLLPLGAGASGITLQGFQYPLTDAAMSIDCDIYGISNELTAEIGEISLKNGCLIVVQCRKLGWEEKDV